MFSKICNCSWKPSFGLRVIKDRGWQSINRMCTVLIFTNLPHYPIKVWVCAFSITNVNKLITSSEWGRFAERTKEKSWAPMSLGIAPYEDVIYDQQNVSKYYYNFFYFFSVALPRIFHKYWSIFTGPSCNTNFLHLNLKDIHSTVQVLHTSGVSSIKLFI